MSSLVTLDVDLDAVIARAMSKDSRRRYSSAGEFYAALEGATRGGSLRKPLRESKAVVACVQARLDPGSVAAPEEALLVDLESVLPLAQAGLEGEGFRVLLSTGDTLVAVGEPGEAAADELDADRALEQAIELLGRLERRRNADRRVQVRICLARPPSSSTKGLDGNELVEQLTAGPEPFTRGLFVARDFVRRRDSSAENERESDEFVRVV